MLLLGLQMLFLGFRAFAVKFAGFPGRHADKSGIGAFGETSGARPKPPRFEAAASGPRRARDGFQGRTEPLLEAQA